MEFQPFPKMGRLYRDVVITEKLDGTNGQIVIFPYSDEEAAKNGALVSEDKQWIMRIGSRTRYLTHEQDNYGFFAWCSANAQELFKLGEGRHFGEWWGKGIQRGYGMEERKFSLFNAPRWGDASDRPRCCHTVPILFRGDFNEESIKQALALLREAGSIAAPGFMDPEGIITYHSAAGIGFKTTLKDDHKPKGQ